MKKKKELRKERTWLLLGTVEDKAVGKRKNTDRGTSGRVDMTLRHVRRGGKERGLALFYFLKRYNHKNKANKSSTLAHDP